MSETVTLKISSVNQITLPSFARKALGIGAGDEMDVRVEGGKIVLEKALTREEKVKQAFAKLDEIRERQFRRMTPEQRDPGEYPADTAFSSVFLPYHEHIDNLPETKEYIREKYNVA